MDILNVWKYLLFLGLLAQISNGYPKIQSSSAYSNSKNSKDFDVIIFSQSWPKTVCSQWQLKSLSNECNLPRNNEWSIHGLWPSYLHKLGPNFCSNIRYDPNALKSIREELTEKWANVHKDNNPDSFWNHEWSKHGTCGVTIDSINSQEKYFQQSIELFDHFSMKNILQKANIFSGKKYSVEKILDGVNKVLGVNSQVVCFKNQKSREQNLQEIRICFDKKFNLTNCDGIKSFPTNCQHGIDVTY